MRVLPLFLMAIVMVVGIVACTENKVLQCSRLNTVVNKISTLTSPGKDPAKWQQLAKQMDMIGQEVKSLPLKDPTLIMSQAKLLSLISEATRSAKGLGEALQKQDIKQRNTTIESIEALLKKEEPIINEINQYCGAT